MALLVRKIARGKWPEDDSVCPVMQLQADAIADLRTRGNTLSVWRIENIDDIEKAVLALAASSKTEKIETMCVVWADESLFQDKGIEIDSSMDGDTVVTDLKTLHRDLAKLSYESLGIISEIIMNGLQEKNTKRFTRVAVRELLVKAYKEERICKDICTEGFYDEVKKAAS